MVDEYDRSVIRPSYCVLENSTAAQIQGLHRLFCRAAHPSGGAPTARRPCTAHLTHHRGASDPADLLPALPQQGRSCARSPEEPHRAEPDQADAAFAAELPTADTLSASIAQRIQVPGFRGCAFLNAVAEYPDPDHRVHLAVLAHRQRFLETVAQLLAKVREAPAEAAAHHFVMMLDGATAAGCLFDQSVVRETFLRGVDVLLRAHATAPYAEPDKMSTAAH